MNSNESTLLKLGAFRNTRTQVEKMLVEPDHLEQIFPNRGQFSSFPVIPANVLIAKIDNGWIGDSNFCSTGDIRLHCSVDKLSKRCVLMGSVEIGPPRSLDDSFDASSIVTHPYFQLRALSSHCMLKIIHVPKRIRAHGLRIRLQ